VIVKFNTAREFLENLQQDQGRVDRRIVRLAMVKTDAGFEVSGLPVQNISVVATCTIAGQTVRLDRYIGRAVFVDNKIRDDDDEGQKTMALAGELITYLTTSLHPHLDLRAGIIEEGVKICEWENVRCPYCGGVDLQEAGKFDMGQAIMHTVVCRSCTEPFAITCHD